MACDPYRRDPLVKMLWKTFGAVPVLPIQPKLAVFSVLMKDKRGFRVIGNLGELCAGGEGKNELVRIISAQDPNYISRSEEYGSISKIVVNDISWFTKILAFQTGASVGMTDVHSWKIYVPSYQSVSSTPRFSQAVNMFQPDSNNLNFAHQRTLDLWIVTEVITAPYLELEALDAKGGHVGANLPPLVPVPLDVRVSGSGGAHQRISIWGPNTGSEVRPLPVAFRGWKCRYEHGLLRNYIPSRMQPDGPGDAAPEPSAGQQEEAHATPHMDDHMHEFVEDNWFASIADD